MNWLLRVKYLSALAIMIARHQENYKIISKTETNAILNPFE